ncbi:MAG: ATP-binding cassette domain-containing protein [Pseudomonadales bacterium]|jgi:ABC-2 type transport system ATP-binding protein|nr:ATP-binding cassette domain-containing protein [Pseudomonadales bacterium]
MSSTAVAVRLEGVHKHFAGAAAAGGTGGMAVRNLSFTVPTGSICGFLGPNGAGKTTTLRMVLGLLRPDAGRIEVLGATDPATRRDRLAYLPEERGLYRRMGVLEFLVFLGRLHGLGAPEARRRADQWLERLGLAASARSRCESLSKGMGQKLQLAGALLHEPELVILDEPFSGLDPVNVELAREIIVELRRAGRTVILSTHVMEQAEQLCDEVLLLDRGTRLLSGTVAAVRASGARTLRISYEGDGRALQGLPGVTRVNDAGVRAELSLAPDADPDRLLEALLGRLRLRRFEFAEPSLHEIFVRSVGQSAGGGEDAA